jgi:ABC-type transporter Mla MlaB component
MNIKKVPAGESGRAHLVLFGEYTFADATEVKQALVEALDVNASEVRLDLAGMERADLTFFQLLFALASQARLEDKRVVLNAPLPEPLRRAAGGLGFSQHDLEQAFLQGDNS